MKKTANLFVLPLLFLLLGCRAYQPVVWKYNAPLDAARGGKVTVSATCAIPAKHMTTLRQTIQHRVSEVLTGRADDPSAYQVEVIITRYDGGDKLSRVLTFGMVGRLRIEGTVRVRETNPPELLSEGTFEKWHGTIMPIANIFSTMDNAVLPKVASAVAKALKKSTKK